MAEGKKIIVDMGLFRSVNFTLANLVSAMYLEYVNANPKAGFEKSKAFEMSITSLHKAVQVMMSDTPYGHPREVENPFEILMGMAKAASVESLLRTAWDSLHDIVKLDGIVFDNAANVPKKDYRWIDRAAIKYTVNP